MLNHTESSMDHKTHQKAPNLSDEEVLRLHIAVNVAKNQFWVVSLGVLLLAVGPISCKKKNKNIIQFDRHKVVFWKGRFRLTCVPAPSFYVFGLCVCSSLYKITFYQQQSDSQRAIKQTYIWFKTFSQYCVWRWKAHASDISNNK